MEDSNSQRWQCLESFSVLVLDLYFILLISLLKGREGFDFGYRIILFGLCFLCILFVFELGYFSFFYNYFR